MAIPPTLEHIFMGFVGGIWRLLLLDLFLRVAMHQLNYLIALHPTAIHQITEHKVKSFEDALNMYYHDLCGVDK